VQDAPRPEFYDVRPILSELKVFPPLLAGTGDIVFRARRRKQLRRPPGCFWQPLEAVHGGVHVWVGGSMSTIPTAPADPIFWMHHANSDRLWALIACVSRAACPDVDSNVEVHSVIHL
jgi:hypothetical protein